MKYLSLEIPKFRELTDEINPPPPLPLILE